MHFHASDAIKLDHDHSRHRLTPEIELTRLVSERHEILVVNHPKEIIAQGDDSIPDVDGPRAVRDSTAPSSSVDPTIGGCTESRVKVAPSRSMMSIRTELTLLTYS